MEYAKLLETVLEAEKDALAMAAEAKEWQDKGANIDEQLITIATLLIKAKHAEHCLDEQALKIAITLVCDARLKGFLP